LTAAPISKDTPTLAENPMPSDTGNQESQCTISAMPLPNTIPKSPPANVREGRFDEKLPENRPPPGAGLCTGRSFGDLDTVELSSFNA
jgi:hypothetical protein